MMSDDEQVPRDANGVEITKGSYVVAPDGSGGNVLGWEVEDDGETVSVSYEASALASDVKVIVPKSAEVKQA